ncbi:MAG: MgtC/SapB family protein [Clostridiales bacterium]|nr:MgtC/SapB family protein [Clostridiales bacterium]
MSLINYFTGNFSVMQELDFLIRILLACVCGACIGIERSRRLKEAGIRTHVIVCCAAALMMIVSKYGFTDLTGGDGAFFDGTRGADPARIAAQVISGIGFLGAGVIFRNGNTVKGLTTAAGIWATAGIGLAIGSGMYIISILFTIIITVLQFVMHKITVGTDSLITHRLQFTVIKQAEFQKRFTEYTAEHQIQILENKITCGADGSIIYDAVLRSPHDMTIQDLAVFLDVKEVSSIDCIPVV